MFRGKWQANLKIYNTSHYLGTFDAEIDAAYAYDAKALELMGSDAATNFRRRQFDGSGTAFTGI